MLIFLAYKAFHDSADLVSVGGNVWSDVLRVECTIGNDVADALHVVNLFRGPAVHGQRLDLGNVCAHFSVQSSATHTQEDSKTPTSPCWVSGSAVGTSVIPRHRLDQILQHTLIARLLPLANYARHLAGRIDEAEATVCIDQRAVVCLSGENRDRNSGRWIKRAT